MTTEKHWMISLYTQFDALRKEVADLRQASDAQAERVRVLTRRIVAIEEERDELKDRLESAQQELARQVDDRTASLRDSIGPPDEFTCLPLVFKSEHGEYLGVSDKSRKHFSLKDFVALIEQNASTTRSIALRWAARGRSSNSGWKLSISENIGQQGSQRSHFINVAAVKTPKGNSVALIERLHFGGKDMPAFFLYELFKQIGREFS